MLTWQTVNEVHCEFKISLKWGYLPLVMPSIETVSYLQSEWLALLKTRHITREYHFLIHVNNVSLPINLFIFNGLLTKRNLKKIEMEGKIWRICFIQNAESIHMREFHPRRNIDSKDLATLNFILEGTQLWIPQENYRY